MLLSTFVASMLLQSSYATTNTNSIVTTNDISSTENSIITELNREWYNMPQKEFSELLDIVNFVNKSPNSPT